MPDCAFGMSNQAKAEVKRGTTAFDNSDMGVNSVRMVKNTHPTVKPLALIRYLATLLLPPESVMPRRILVPFAGSGSEMIGCLQAGWDEVVGIESDTEHGYVKIAEARLQFHSKEINVESTRSTGSSSATSETEATRPAACA